MKSRNYVTYAVVLVFMCFHYQTLSLSTKLRTSTNNNSSSEKVSKDFSHVAEQLVNDGGIFNFKTI